MKRTKFMSRVAEAMESEETKLLDQIESDLQEALDEGTSEAEGQYSMEKLDDDSVKIHDLKYDEDTLAKFSDEDEVILSACEEIKPEPKKKTFTFVDEDSEGDTAHRTSVSSIGRIQLP